MRTSWLPEVSCFKMGRMKNLLNKSKAIADEECRSRPRRCMFEQPSPSVFEKDVNDVKGVDRFRYQYLSKISAQKAWIPQAERKPKHQTVIVFDWDDTLLYTTFMNYLQGRKVPENTKSHLKRIEQSAYQLLETALGLGHTFIITNAVSGWVEESAAQFMPSLIPILDRVRIISARSTQAANCDGGDIGQWKTKAFLEMGREFDSDILTNLISIGDSNYELEAANTLGREFSSGFIKTVKLKECPSPHEQTKELDLLVPKLQTIVEKACDLKVKLEKKQMY